MVTGHFSPGFNRQPGATPGHARYTPYGIIGYSILIYPAAYFFPSAFGARVAFQSAPPRSPAARVPLSVPSFSSRPV